MKKLPLLASAAATLGVLHLSGCSVLEAADKNGDGILDSSELNDLTDQLLSDALKELGLEELGGIFLDSSDYADVPDTLVDPVDDDTANGDTSTSLTSVDLSTWMPEPESQGAQGSCTGWASASIMNFYYNYENDITEKFTQDLNRFSPSYIYNQIKLDDNSCDGGSYVNLAAEFLVGMGDVKLSTFAYNDQICPAPSTSLESQAQQYQRSEYRRVPFTVEQMKTWLKLGTPLLAAILVDDDFVDLSAGQVYRNFSGSGGGHAIVIAGFDDDKQAFLLYNSWGTAWADDGHGWVSYSTMTKMLVELYVVL